MREKKKNFVFRKKILFYHTFVYVLLQSEVEKRKERKREREKEKLREKLLLFSSEIGFTSRP